MTPEKKPAPPRAQPALLWDMARASKGLLAAASAACIAHGAASMLMVPLINRILFAGEQERAAMFWQFAALALAVLSSQALGSLLFVHLRHGMLARLREHVSARVMAAPFGHLEALGAARIHSALSKQAGDVAAFLLNLPQLISSAVAVLGCFVYMGLLSSRLLIVAGVVISLGALGYAMAQARAVRHVRLAAQQQDRLFEHFTAMTGGAKELKLNQAKARRFWHGLLLPSVQRVRREGVRAGTIFTMAFSWGNFLVNAFIGLVVFWVVADSPDRAQLLSGFALTMVFMITPLDMLLSTLPEAHAAAAAARQIGEVTQALEKDEASRQAAALPAPALESIALEGVTHSYFHEPSESHFTLGPIDLRFQPGEVVFLVGGNGSGKTTLAKLLVGLYPAEGGSLRLNGHVVDDGNRPAYRQLFSAVFSDFHLFEQLLESRDGSEIDEQGNSLLRDFQLDHKVRIKDGAFSTRELSQGQRKRLALVVAVLEDRPFLVFDEWAADQDPAFKDVFYLRILPALKRRGKAVLVISHDDRYFHVGDRVVHLEDGKVVAPVAVPPGL